MIVGPQRPMLISINLGWLLWLPECTASHGDLCFDRRCTDFPNWEIYIIIYISWSIIQYEYNNIYIFIYIWYMHTTHIVHQYGIAIISMLVVFLRFCCAGLTTRSSSTRRNTPSCRRPTNGGIPHGVYCRVPTKPYGPYVTVPFGYLLHTADGINMKRSCTSW